MTLSEATQKIGKRVITHLRDDVTLEWTIVDYKQTYGKDRWKVEPVAGTGSTWFESSSLYIKDEN